MDSRNLRFLVLMALCAIPFFLYFNLVDLSYSAGNLPTNLEPANSTLGFGGVIAISRASSPRRQGLIYAANLTGIELHIPDQPTWTDNDIQGLKSNWGSKINRGSSLAWLGHLNALRWFLSTDMETAMFIEDDVDWDIWLRTAQIPRTAAAFRSLIRSHDAGYWGDLAQWEILYLGHCGDFFHARNNYTYPRKMYQDDTLLPISRMHTYTQKFVNELGFREQERMVHRSYWPLCTFGYAVTRESARRIVEELAAHEEDGGTQAYDVRILEACRDLDWLCYSVNPELLHHQEAPSEIAETNFGVDEMGRLKAEDELGAPNIGCGARSKDFMSTDPATVKYLQKVVGTQGQCLVDQMRDDMKRWP